MAYAVLDLIPAFEVISGVHSVNVDFETETIFPDNYRPYPRIWRLNLKPAFLSHTNNNADPVNVRNG
jgi:hypothetical protein